MLVWLKQIRFRCWRKIIEVGPVAVAEIRLRVVAELGGHRILKYNGVATQPTATIQDLRRVLKVPNLSMACVPFRVQPW